MAVAKALKRTHFLDGEREVGGLSGGVSVGGVASKCVRLRAVDTASLSSGVGSGWFKMRERDCTYSKIGNNEL